MAQMLSLSLSLSLSRFHIFLLEFRFASKILICFAFSVDLVIFIEPDAICVVVPWRLYIFCFGGLRAACPHLLFPFLSFLGGGRGLLVFSFLRIPLFVFVRLFFFSLSLSLYLFLLFSFSFL